MSASSTPDDGRLQRLERRFTLLALAFTAYVVFTASIFVYDWRARRQVLSTSTLFTSEVQLPHPSRWSDVAVGGGIAPDPDGRSIGLWLSSGILQGLRDPRTAGQQIRLELDASGTEHLLFIDRAGKRRLRLALASDGSPSIELFDPAGHLTWSTSSPAH